MNSRYRFCVAPMMDWTDRHERYFLRLISQRAHLYTEMVTADAVRFGDRDRLLDFSVEEHPVALQLGGSNPQALAEASLLGAQWGYDEINLNVGCPSDRVQSGQFGACLMRDPDLVARCVAAMRAAVANRFDRCVISVKCRLGVDEQDPGEALPALIEKCRAEGVSHFIIHARKAWLEGLSPKENREVPPLDYEWAYQMKQSFPDLTIVVNGGIETLSACTAHLQKVDGVMVGRAAYKNPYVLEPVDRLFFADQDNNEESIVPMAPKRSQHEAQHKAEHEAQHKAEHEAEHEAEHGARMRAQRPAAALSREDIIEAYIPYVAHMQAQGVPGQAMIRHILGLYAGCPGGRMWRRYLSENLPRADDGAKILAQSLDLMRAYQQRAA